MHADVGPMSETRGAENADYGDSDNKNSGISWVLIVMMRPTETQIFHLHA